MTDPKDIVKGFEERAKQLGLPMATICQRVQIAQSTITRWKKGTFEPTFRRLRKIEAALAAAEAERTDAPTTLQVG